MSSVPPQDPVPLVSGQEERDMLEPEVKTPVLQDKVLPVTPPVVQDEKPELAYPFSWASEKDQETLDNRDRYAAAAGQLPEYTFEQKEETIMSRPSEERFPLALAAFGSVRKAFDMTYGGQPTKAQKTDFYADYLHLPKSFVVENFDQVEKEYVFADMQRHLASAPRLRAWVADPANMAKLGKGAATLARLEAALVSRHGGFFEQAWHGVSNVPSEMISSFYQNIRAVAENIPQGIRDPIVSLLGDPAESAIQWSEGLSPLTEDVPAVQRFFAQIPATVAQIGTYIAAGPASLPLIASQEFGGAYGEARRRGVSPNNAFVAAMYAAPINTALERMQLRNIGNMGKIFSNAVKFKSFTSAAAGQLVKNSLEQAGQEMLQGGITELSITTSELDDGKDLKPDGLWDRAKDTLKEAAYEGALVAASSILLGGVGGARRVTQQYFTAQRNLKVFDATVKAQADAVAEGSSEEAASAAIDEITRVDPTSKSSFTAKNLQVYFQVNKENGVGDFKEQLLAKLGISEDEFNKALLEPGGQVWFDTGKFRDIMKTNIGLELSRFVKIGGALSEAERGAHVAEIVKRTTAMSDVHADMLLEKEPDHEKYKEWKKQLREEGQMTSEEVDATMLLTRQLHNYYLRQKPGATIEEAIEAIGLEFKFDETSAQFKERIEQAGDVMFQMQIPPSVQAWNKASVVKGIWFHGTLNDFTQFNAPDDLPSQGGEEAGNLGKGIYLTNSEDDVKYNYGDVEGADQAFKVDRFMEGLDFDFDIEEAIRDDPDKLREYVVKHFFDHTGAVMPLVVSITNPAVIGPSSEVGQAKETLLSGEILERVINGFHNLDLSDRELDEISSSLRVLEADFDVVSVQELFDVSVDVLNHDGTTAAGYALEHAGFDGIIDNTVKRKFPRMLGLTSGTQHVVVFDPKNVKSVFHPGTPTSHPNIFRQGETGAINLSDGKAIISLFENANMSTIAHEFAHGFHRVMQNLVREGGAENTEQLQADLKTLEDFGSTEDIARAFEQYLKDGKAPTNKLHMVFQRFVRWLTDIYSATQNLINAERMTPEVRNVLGSWLAARSDMEIYESLGLKGSVADSIEKTKDKEKKKKGDPVTTDKSRQKWEDEIAVALEKNVKQRMAAWKKLLGGHKGIKEHALDRVKKTRAYEIVEYLSRGKGKKAGIPLLALVEALEGGDVDALVKDLVAAHGPAIMEHRGDKRKKSELKAKDLSDLAELYDFESVQALMDWLVDQPNTNQAVKATTEQIYQEHEAAVRQMLESSGVNFNAKAMHSDAALSVLLVEQAMLAEQLGKEISRQQRKHIIDRMKAVAESRTLYDPYFVASRVDIWLNKEASAAKNAVAAAKKGDFELADEYMDERLQYFFLVKAALNMKEEYAKILRGLSKKRTENRIKKVPAGKFADAIQALLRYYRFWETTERTDEKTKDGKWKRKTAVPEGLSFTWDFLPAKNYGGVEVAIPDWIKTFQRPVPTRTRGKEPVAYSTKELSLIQMREFSRTINFLLDQGAGELAEKKNARFESLEQIRQKSIGILKGMQKKGKRYLNLKLARQISSWITIPEFLLTEADGDLNVVEGPLQQIFQNLHDAETLYRTLENDLIEGTDKTPGIGKALTAAEKRAKEWHKKWGKRSKTLNGVAFPEILVTETSDKGYWTFNMAFSVLMNSGNEGNLFTLTHGQYNFSEADVKSILSTFDKKTLLAAQEIWDTIGTLFPALAKVTLEMQNRVLPKVEPSPQTVVSSDGESVFLRGGYLPIVFDPRLSERGRQNADLQLIGMQLGTEAMFRAGMASNASATKERIDYDPEAITPDIFLDPTVIFGHIRKTLRHITHARALTDAFSLFTQTGAKGGIESSWATEFRKVFGAEKHRMLVQWLEFQANPTRKIPSDPLSKALLWMKNKLTVASLGLNVFVAAKQRLSMANGYNHLLENGSNGSFHFANSVALFWSGMGAFDPKLKVKWNVGPVQQTMEKIHSLSNMMKTRNDAGMRDVSDVFRDIKKNAGLSGKFSRIFESKKVQEAMFYLIRANDAAAVYPMWWAAYNQALAGDTSIEMGDNTEQNKRDAATYADQVIRKTQPSSLGIDLSQAQRTEGVSRLILLFQTWAMKKGNRIMDHVSGKLQGRYTYLQSARFFAFEIALPLYLMMATGALFIDDEEEFDWKEMYQRPLEDLISWAPGVSHFKDVYQAKFGRGGIPALKGVELLGKAYDSISDEQEEAVDKFIKMGQAMEWFIGAPVITQSKRFLKKMKQAGINVGAID